MWTKKSGVFLRALIVAAVYPIIQNDRFERELLHQSSLSKWSFWMMGKSAATMSHVRNTPPFCDPIGSHKHVMLSYHIMIWYDMVWKMQSKWFKLPQYRRPKHLYGKPPRLQRLRLAIFCKFWRGARLKIFWKFFPRKSLIWEKNVYAWRDMRSYDIIFFSSFKTPILTKNHDFSILNHVVASGVFRTSAVNL